MTLLNDIQSNAESFFINSKLGASASAGQMDYYNLVSSMEFSKCIMQVIVVQCFYFCVDD